MPDLLTEKQRVEQANLLSHSLWHEREPGAPKLVYEGGLGICKQCNQLEQGLYDHPCTHVKLKDWEPPAHSPGKKPRVYVASKLRHAKEIRSEALAHENIQFTSGWIYLCEHVSDDSKGMADNFWAANLKDLRACDILVIFGDPEDKLRGALIEAGYALALGKTVIVVGDHSDFGTWQHMDDVMWAPSFKAALIAIERGKYEKVS